MWFLHSPLVFLSLLIGRWENLRHRFFMVSTASNFKRRSFKSRKRERIKATSSWRRLESNWISGNILEHTEKRSSARTSWTLLLQYLMWNAQDNFCFCYFAERFMLKAKIRLSERLCVKLFSLTVITPAFSQRQSEKANWSMNRPLGVYNFLFYPSQWLHYFWHLFQLAQPDEIAERIMEAEARIEMGTYGLE